MNKQDPAGTGPHAPNSPSLHSNSPSAPANTNPLTSSASADRGLAENGTRWMRLTTDGRRLKELVRAGYFWLKHNEKVVNDYNVYPVPDGDTGTNMMHTMRSAWEAIANLDEPNVGRMAKAVANGALRGSRGNSGIILSQLWRGFARSLEGKDVMDAQDMVLAFKESARTAYGGVSTPVEGTILTVARETAEGVEHAARNTHDTRALLGIAVQSADASVQRTPTLLKILKEAGVVDSGGYGLLIILSGMRRFLDGLPTELNSAEKISATDETRTDSHTGLPIQEGGWGYDVQYLIYAPRGRTLNVNAVRAAIEAMGDCPLVIGDEEVVKVHVHVPDPGVPISYGAQLGSLRDVVVEDMQAQSESFGEGKAVAAEEPLPEADIAVVAVASGAGLVRMFKDIGVRIVIEGGQTMNPSVDDFLNAIQKANARHVILLPNNGNIVMTAQQAAELSPVPAQVVPTKTLPQGIAAAISFNYTGSLDENTSNMVASLSRVTTGEITTSTRNVTINGVTVRDGQVIGLINDKLAVAGADVPDTLLDLLQKADAASHELITLYYGNGLTANDAEQVAEQVRATYPNQQVDVYAGDQPHYWFVIGIE